MTYAKKFPKEVDGKTVWEEVSLTQDEELDADVFARTENKFIMMDCIEEAKKIISEKGLKIYQTDIVNLAIALFGKRAAHVVYHKENRAKSKFDSM